MCQPRYATADSLMSRETLLPFRVGILTATRPSKLSRSEDCSCAAALVLANQTDLAKADAKMTSAARVINLKSSAMTHYLLALICTSRCASPRSTDQNKANGLAAPLNCSSEN